MSNKRPVALDHTHEPATTTYDGFLSKTDKIKLNASYTGDEIDALLAGKSDIAHNHDDRYYTETEITTLLSGKQDTLVSGTNIKTINGSSVLGSGDLAITSVTDWTKVFDDSGTYRGYKAKSGSSTGYMRTPSEGLLPYASIASGSGYVGTPAWPFLNIYGINIYQDGDKVLAIAGQETTNPRTLKMSDGTIIKSGSASVTTAITAAYGGGFYVSATVTITFDTSFPFTVAPSVTPFITGAVDVSYLSVSVSTTNFVIKLWKYGSTSPASYTVYYNAIGR